MAVRVNTIKSVHILKLWREDFFSLGLLILKS